MKYCNCRIQNGIKDFQIVEVVSFGDYGLICARDYKKGAHWPWAKNDFKPSDRGVERKAGGILQHSDSCTGGRGQVIQELVVRL